MLCGFAAWIAVEPMVFAALLVAVAAALAAVVLPLAVIRAVAALDDFYWTTVRSVRELVVTRKGDETTTGEPTVTEQ